MFEFVMGACALFSTIVLYMDRRHAATKRYAELMHKQNELYLKSKQLNIAYPTEEELYDDHVKTMEAYRKLGSQWWRLY